MNEPNLEPGKWTYHYDPEKPIFFRREWICGDCGESFTYGTTPYCPFCGKRKVDVPSWFGEEKKR